MGNLLIDYVFRFFISIEQNVFFKLKCEYIFRLFFFKLLKLVNVYKNNYVI